MRREKRTRVSCLTFPTISLSRKSNALSIATNKGEKREVLVYMLISS